MGDGGGVWGTRRFGGRGGEGERERERGRGRERGREGEREGGRARAREGGIEREGGGEREGEREREGGRERESSSAFAVEYIFWYFPNSKIFDLYFQKMRNQQGLRGFRWTYA